jgi:ABC-type microcin C transport system permease subunit YejB
MHWPANLTSPLGWMIASTVLISIKSLPHGLASAKKNNSWNLLVFASTIVLLCKNIGMALYENPLLAFAG